VSVRAVRWDTGREHEIPKDFIRWGPDTKQGTCRAALLHGPLADLEGGARSVPYVLPFAGAKWAVRVTLAQPDAPPETKRPVFKLWWWRPAAAFAGSAFPADDPYWIGTGWRDDARAAREDREKLGSLLEAAGDALRAEEEQERPDALGEALELLAEAIDPNVYSFEECHAFTARVRALLERETSAEIRRAWKGPILSDGDVGTLRTATALLRHTPADRDVADALCDLTDRLVFWRRKAAARG
jgi:hypothetical protein